MARRGKGRGKQVEIVGPTPEQMSSAAFSVEPVHDRTPTGGLNLKGTAYRRRPMIDILAAAGLFTEGEHKALRDYRHHADIADRSLIKDSLGKRIGGSGGGSDGPTVSTLNAVRITADCERAVGSLVDILRAVVVDDLSLSQWAMRRAGTIEQHRERKGKVIVTLEPHRKALDIARLEIKFVAERIQSEVEAGSRDRTRAA